MKILIAEDDYVSRRLLNRNLENWGHEVVSTENGSAAWNVLQGSEPPNMAVLDWMMPEMDGVEVCRLVRQNTDAAYTYIILLTAKGSAEDISTGLDAGADDYVTKPFDPAELRSRLRVGERVLELEKNLQTKVTALQEALHQVRTLKELLPICMYCKRVRDDSDYWHQIESYIHSHTGTDFTHGICPDCFQRMSDQLSEVNKPES